MPEITTVRFEPWHAKLVKPGKYYNSSSLHPEIRALLFRQMEGVTLLLDGEIAAILGVAELWSGVAEVTMIPSDLFYDNLKTCVKIVRETVQIAASMLGCHRVQATALASYPAHGRFLRCMGLQKEGVLRGYGPGGEDFEMYAAVFNR